VKKDGVIGFLENLITMLKQDGAAILENKQGIIAGLQDSCAEVKQLQQFDFREIGDHLYDGIYLADGQGKTLFINKAYTRITEIQPEEVVGKYVDDLVAAGIYKNAVTMEVIKGKTQVNAVGESLRNGIKMLITGSPIFDEEGAVKNVVVIDREITDLLTMKDELERSQQKMQAVEKDKVKTVREVELLRRQQLSEGMIGGGVETKQLLMQVRQVAGLDTTVLITGETGTGKEVVANEIYINSPRQNGPFIKVNCAAIPANLLEAELFGYEKGAFTGATTTGKMGLFELADKGTLLLDEIGEMPLELQAKLLRVLQQKEVTRIGGVKPIKLDVRIISATNCDLKELVKRGKFREDLYYRLYVFPIEITPLRARLRDIEDLAQHFLAMYNAKYGKHILLPEAGVKLFAQYSWPGNVRELQNVIERLVIIAEPGAGIGVEQISGILNLVPQQMDTIAAGGLKEMVERVEREAISKALQEQGSTRKAAKILKIDQSTIVKKAKRLGIGINDE